MRKRAPRAEHEVPHVCHICAAELKPHERAEGFCDVCLRKAQTQPILKHDRQEGIRA